MLQPTWWSAVCNIITGGRTAPISTSTAATVPLSATRTVAAPGSTHPAPDEAHRDRAGAEYLDIPAGGAIGAFQIMRTPVTNAMYHQAVVAGACPMPDRLGGQRLQDPEYADHPVVLVRRSAARAYASWVGGVLPSDAEWLRAAFGDDDRPYPWGHEPADDRRANVWFAQLERYGERPPPDDTTPVGWYPAGASPYGVLDLFGNVWEWIDATPAMARGGAYSTAATVLHRGLHVRPQPNDASPAIGFRVVRRSGP